VAWTLWQLGSRKYLLASLDQSLNRMGLDYVDIFYSHRPDPETPVEETMAALASAVHSGKVLYIGISNYNPEQTTKAASMLQELKTPCLIHQIKYSVFQRTPESGLLKTLAQEGVGGIAFSPLAQGLLSDRYLQGVRSDSRAGGPSVFLRPANIGERRLLQLRALRELVTLPPIAHPGITGVSQFLTCTGKLSQNSLEISACAVRFVPVTQNPKN